MRIDLVYANPAAAKGDHQDAYVDRDARKGKGPSDHAPGDRRPRRGARRGHRPGRAAAVGARHARAAPRSCRRRPRCPTRSSSTSTASCSTPSSAGTRPRRRSCARRAARWRDEAPEVMMGMSSPEWSAYLRDDLRVPLEHDAINRRGRAAHGGRLPRRACRCCPARARPSARSRPAGRSAWPPPPTAS